VEGRIKTKRLPAFLALAIYRKRNLYMHFTFLLIFTLLYSVYPFKYSLCDTLFLYHIFGLRSFLSMFFCVKVVSVSFLLVVIRGTLVRIFQDKLLYLAWGRRSWLRYCVTSRKDSGSIPDVVIGIFH